MTGRFEMHVSLGLGLTVPLLSSRVCFRKNQKHKERKERDKNETDSITLNFILQKMQLLHEKFCNWVAPQSRLLHMYEDRYSVRYKLACAPITKLKPEPGGPSNKDAP